MKEIIKIGCSKKQVSGPDRRLKSTMKTAKAARKNFVMNIESWNSNKPQDKNLVIVSSTKSSLREAYGPRDGKNPNSRGPHLDDIFEESSFHPHNDSIQTVSNQERSLDPGSLAQNAVSVVQPENPSIFAEGFAVGNNSSSQSPSLQQSHRHQDSSIEDDSVFRTRNSINIETSAGNDFGGVTKLRKSSVNISPKDGSKIMKPKLHKPDLRPSVLFHGQYYATSTGNSVMEPSNAIVGGGVTSIRGQSFDAEHTSMGSHQNILMQLLSHKYMQAISSFHYPSDVDYQPGKITSQVMRALQDPTVKNKAFMITRICEGEIKPKKEPEPEVEEANLIERYLAHNKKAKPKSQGLKTRKQGKSHGSRIQTTSGLQNNFRYLPHSRGLSGTGSLKKGVNSSDQSANHLLVEPWHVVNQRQLDSKKQNIEMPIYHKQLQVRKPKSSTIHFRLRSHQLERPGDLKAFQLNQAPKKTTEDKSVGGDDQEINSNETSDRIRITEPVMTAENSAEALDPDQSKPYSKHVYIKQLGKRQVYRNAPRNQTDEPQVPLSPTTGSTLRDASLLKSQNILKKQTSKNQDINVTNETTRFLEKVRTAEMTNNNSSDADHAAKDNSIADDETILLLSGLGRTAESRVAKPHKKKTNSSCNSPLRQTRASKEGNPMKLDRKEFSSKRGVSHSVHQSDMQCKDGQKKLIQSLQGSTRDESESVAAIKKEVAEPAVTENGKNLDEEDAERVLQNSNGGDVQATQDVIDEAVSEKDGHQLDSKGLKLSQMSQHSVSPVKLEGRQLEPMMEKTLKQKIYPKAKPDRLGKRQAEQPSNSPISPQQSTTTKIFKQSTVFSFNSVPDASSRESKIGARRSPAPRNYLQTTRMSRIKDLQQQSRTKGDDSAERISPPGGCEGLPSIGNHACNTLSDSPIEINMQCVGGLRGLINAGDQMQGLAVRPARIQTHGRRNEMNMADVATSPMEFDSNSGNEQLSFTLSPKTPNCQFMLNRLKNAQYSGRGFPLMDFQRQSSEESDQTAVNKNWSHSLPRGAHTTQFLSELVPLPEEDDTKTAKQKRKAMPQETSRTTEELTLLHTEVSHEPHYSKARQTFTQIQAQAQAQAQQEQILATLSHGRQRNMRDLISRTNKARVSGSLVSSEAGSSPVNRRLKPQYSTRPQTHEKQRRQKSNALKAGCIVAVGNKDQLPQNAKNLIVMEHCPPSTANEARESVQGDGTMLIQSNFGVKEGEVTTISMDGGDSRQNQVKTSNNLRRGSAYMHSIKGDSQHNESIVNEGRRAKNQKPFHLNSVNDDKSMLQEDIISRRTNKESTTQPENEFEEVLQPDFIKSFGVTKNGKVLNEDIKSRKSKQSRIAQPISKRESRHNQGFSQHQKESDQRILNTNNVYIIDRQTIEGGGPTMMGPVNRYKPRKDDVRTKLPASFIKQNINHQVKVISSEVNQSHLSSLVTPVPSSVAVPTPQQQRTGIVTPTSVQPVNDNSPGPVHTTTPSPPPHVLTPVNNDIFKVGGTPGLEVPDNAESTIDFDLTELQRLEYYKEKSIEQQRSIEYTQAIPTKALTLGIEDGEKKEQTASGHLPSEQFIPSLRNSFLRSSQHQQHLRLLQINGLTENRMNSQKQSVVLQRLPKPPHVAAAQNMLSLADANVMGTLYGSQTRTVHTTKAGVNILKVAGDSGDVLGKNAKTISNSYEDLINGKNSNSKHITYSDESAPVKLEAVMALESSQPDSVKIVPRDEPSAFLPHLLHNANEAPLKSVELKILEKGKVPNLRKQNMRKHLLSMESRRLYNEGDRVFNERIKLAEINHTFNSATQRLSFKNTPTASTRTSVRLASRQQPPSKDSGMHSLIRSGEFNPIQESIASSNGQATKVQDQKEDLLESQP